MDEVFRTILAATDGSESGERAVSFATGLARKHGASLVLCTAVDNSTAIASCASPYGFDAGRMIETLDDAAAAILDGAAERAAGAGVSFTKIVLTGRVAEAIVECADARHADAIVVGKHGQSGLERFLLGSTAADVLRRTDIPAFVVPPGCDPDDVAIERVLVALDDSEPSDAALHFAMRLAEAERASLLLCTAIDTRDLFSKAATYGYDPAPFFEDLRRAAAGTIGEREAAVEARHIAHETTIVNGEPTSAIVASARLNGADAIVIGTHGRRGLRRMFLGSVAEGVVRDAAVPVAVVRVEPPRATPAGARSQGEAAGVTRGS